MAEKEQGWLKWCITDRVVVAVVVSSSHQSPSLGVSLFRSALSITILL